MLLDVSGLNVFFRQPGGGERRVISDLAFAVAHGESVGLVGESGCGKTVTGLSLLGLLPPDIARVTGRIGFEGTDLTLLGERRMREVRGRSIAMIFQEPMSALDPVFTVGEQIAETIRTHFRVGAERSAGTRRGGARGRRHSVARAPLPRVSAPALGRDAPAGHDRDRALV